MVVRAVLFGEETSEPDLSDYGALALLDWGRALPCRESSMCKGPEVEKKALCGRKHELVPPAVSAGESDEPSSQTRPTWLEWKPVPGLLGHSEEGTVGKLVIFQEPILDLVSTSLLPGCSHWVQTTWQTNFPSKLLF